MVTQADKARATILMDRPNYITKVENLLKDRTTYVPLKASSTPAYMKLNEGLLTRLENAKLAFKTDVKSAIENETHAANLYALFKTHKKDAPPRPIVNTRNSMGFFAAGIVTKILRGRDTVKYNVLNSREAVDKLRTLKLLPDERFYSFDIVSMFTNIPVNRAIEAVVKRQKALTLDKVELKLIIDIIKFVCNTSTEIMFNNRIYKQIRGLRMGSSLSPILADFVVEDMLDSAFKKIPKPLLLIKYVDDILSVIEEDKAMDMLKQLNEMDEHIKFEIEKEDNNRINYLDFTIINEGLTPKTKWYQKHVASGQFLNYHSHHPKTVIWNTAVAYVVTMLLNSHTDFVNEIIETAIDRLTRNSYPKEYVRKVILTAQEKIISKMGATQSTSKDDTEDGKYTRSLSYIPGLTEKLKKVIQTNAAKTEENANIIIPGKPIYTMSQQIYNQQKNTNKGTDLHITTDEDDIDLTQEGN